jgi:crotonobetainyl-CoA:carnitine CoA-transferase CaiB-like acyl-CoA transferase
LQQAAGQDRRARPLPSRGVGEHTRDVLASAGLADADIEELIRSGVVTAGGPMPQSLPAAYR